MSRTRLQCIAKQIHTAVARRIRTESCEEPHHCCNHNSITTRQVRMANGRENIYKSCWGTALAAHNRLLKITATDQLARDMDSQWARANDPFNSVHRLPPIVTKCGASNDNRMWVLRRMCHMATHLSVSVSSSDFSVDGLPGARPDPDPATGSCSERGRRVPLPQVAGPTWDRGQRLLAGRPPREPC